MVQQQIVPVFVDSLGTTAMMMIQMSCFAMGTVQMVELASKNMVQKQVVFVSVDIQEIYAQMMM